MNDKEVSSYNAESTHSIGSLSSQGTSTLNESGTQPLDHGEINPTASDVSGGLEREGRRRRRSRSKDKQSKSFFGRSKEGQRSKGRNRTSHFHLTEKILLFGCGFLLVLGFFVGGYFCGIKFGRPADGVNHPVVQDAPFPTAEADLLLDSAFGAYHRQNYREAMMSFQKVLDIQPALVGIDCLIAESAYRAGEMALAEEAARHAVSKNESVEQAHVLLSLINLAKSKSDTQMTQQLADPNVTAESDIKQLVATHLGDAKAYAVWGDFLRQNGSFRSAADILHKGVLRTDPDQSNDLISAKEQLAILQNKPAKSAPSLAEMTSMNAEQSLIAAFSSLQLHQVEEAGSFLERARDLYPHQIFRALMNDNAFAEYRTESQLKQFFKTDVP